MQKRELLANIAERSGLLKVLSGRLSFRKKGPLTILAYHRIARYPGRADHQYDDDLISATQDNFDKQISWLKRYYEIVTFEQLKHLETSANHLIVTFDDGYRDNYDLAYPILKKHGVKATIFLATGYIGAKELFWWDEIAYMVKKTSVLNFTVTLEQDYKYNLGSEANKRFAISSLAKLAKRVSNDNRLRLLDQIRKALEVRIPDGISSDMILSWAQILEMSSNGIEFGAHSVTHPILANMSETEARHEIEYSKKNIECVTGKKVTVFSYPVGGHDKFSAATRELVKKAGYSYAVSYVHGVNYFSKLDPFCMKRLDVEWNDTFHIFKAKLLMPNYIRY
jgi:peptidoglycan/xylan/chitin deacetylase (PgdA/CDA1 family)